MTYAEIWEIVQSLPCEPAPPGFIWEYDKWQSGPSYIAWRRMFSKTVDQSDGKMLTAMCCLSIGELELPKEQRDQCARMHQETACMSIIDLCVERGAA